MADDLQRKIEISARLALGPVGQGQDRAQAFVSLLAGTVRYDDQDLAETIWSVLEIGPMVDHPETSTP